MAKRKSMDAHIWASILGIKTVYPKATHTLNINALQSVIQSIAVCATQEEAIQENLTATAQDRADLLDAFILAARQVNKRK